VRYLRFVFSMWCVAFLYKGGGEREGRGCGGGGEGKDEEE